MFFPGFFFSSVASGCYVGEVYRRSQTKINIIICKIYPSCKGVYYIKSADFFFLLKSLQTPVKHDIQYYMIIIWIICLLTFHCAMHTKMVLQSTMNLPILILVTLSSHIDNNLHFDLIINIQYWSIGRYVNSFASRLCTI